MQKILCICLVLVSSYSVAAGCSREDVAFYLEKGFSKEQITALCSPCTQAPSVQSQSLSIDKEKQDAIVKRLQKALKVDDLLIDGEYLTFRQKTEVQYGEEDEFGQLPDVYPLFDVKIVLKTLRVIKANKRVPILRGASVLVSGDVEQSVRSLESFNKKQKQGIKEHLDEIGMNTVKIAVDADANLQQLVKDINDLGEMYR